MKCKEEEEEEAEEGEEEEKEKKLARGRRQEEGRRTMAPPLMAALRVGERLLKRPPGGHEDGTFGAQCSLLLFFSRFVGFEKQKQKNKHLFDLSDGDKKKKSELQECCKLKERSDFSYSIFIFSSTFTLQFLCSLLLLKKNVKNGAIKVKRRWEMLLDI